RRNIARTKEEKSRKPGDSIVVLDNISLEINEGELVCILGPSGCGKSTLLRIIAGFDTNTIGNVLINGKKVRGPSAEHIFVFQHNGLLPWMTVWQNVGLGLRRIEDEIERSEKTQEYIDMVELSGFEHHYPYQLSGGMQRRVELARALAVNPDVLFMDEPFTGLDFLTHMKMREEVVNMHELIRKTMLFVTHDIDDALLMGDKIVVLSERPTKIKLLEQLEFPHPRDFASEPELDELRKEVFLMLGVNYVV
ncbi:MAG TPA: ABC transporter ATP-binding protein, partial [Thermodesulfovibrionia bacterium]|nr:ABC transporter ATP-binding protein [Thermodesulfovibrionia bacterium]